MIAVAMLGGCTHEYRASGHSARAIHSGALDPKYSLKSITLRSFDTVILPGQPRRSARFAEFMMRGKVGALERFENTAGNVFSVQLDSASFDTAAGSSCRRVTVLDGTSIRFETRACSMDGTLWYVLRRLSEVGN